MKKLALIICLALIPTLGACDTIKEYLPGCKQDAGALIIGLTAMDSLALQYVNKPICGSPHAGQICSQIFIVRKIMTAKNAAKIAVKASINTCDQDIFTAAQTALQAYTDIVNVVTPPKNSSAIDKPSISP